MQEQRLAFEQNLNIKREKKSDSGRYMVVYGYVMRDVSTHPLGRDLRSTTAALPE